MSTAVPPGTPGLRASRRAGPSGRLTNQRREGPGTGRRASAPRGGNPTRSRRGARPPVGDRSPEDCVSTPLRWHKMSISGEKNHRARRRRLPTDLSGLLGTGLGPPDPGHHPIPASGRSGWATWSTPEAGEPRRQARRARRRDTPHRNGRRRGQGPPRTTAPPNWDSGRGREGKRTTEAPPTNGPPTAHPHRPGRPVSGDGKTGEEKSSRTDRDPRVPPSRSTSPSTCLPAGPGPGPRRRNGTPENRVRRHRPPRARTRAGDSLPGHTRGRRTVNVSRSGLG